MDTVGERLRLARNEAGMRQIDVAELVGVTERSIQAYENDEVIPYRFVNQMAEIFDRSVAWILHGDEATKTPGDVTPLLEEMLVELRTIAKALNSTPARPRATAKTTSKTKTKTKATGRSVRRRK